MAMVTSYQNEIHFIKTYSAVHKYGFFVFDVKAIIDFKPSEL